MRIVDETRRSWPSLSLYERFQQMIALALTLLVACLIVMATWTLVVHIARLLASGAVDPAHPEIIQAIFGMIMIVLIALEFNHTLLGVLERKGGIVQVRTVVLIALLAVLRKFIILEIGETSAAEILILSAAVVALGAVLWIVGEQERRSSEPPDASQWAAIISIAEKVGCNPETLRNWGPGRAGCRCGGRSAACAMGSGASVYRCLKAAG